MSWPTAHTAFIADTEAVLADPGPVAVLDINQTRRGKSRWTREQGQPHRGPVQAHHGAGTALRDPETLTQRRDGAAFAVRG